MKYFEIHTHTAGSGHIDSNQVGIWVNEWNKSTALFENLEDAQKVMKIRVRKLEHFGFETDESGNFPVAIDTLDWASGAINHPNGFLEISFEITKATPK